MTAGVALTLAFLTMGAQIKIGSKKFTESVLLGEIATQLLTEQGISAVHRAELGGTRILWTALLHGDIDAYVEYTGSLKEELLGNDKASGKVDLAEALARRGVVLGPSLGFDDSYGLGMRRAAASGLGIETIADLIRHPSLRFGLSHEFLDRVDGWAAVKARYGFAPSQVLGLDHDVAYRAVSSGAVDVTDVYTTDPEILAHDLALLKDDRHVFPEYQAVLIYRSGLPDNAVRVLNQLRGRMDVRTMRELNARAQLQKVPASQIAVDFVAAKFGLRSVSASKGLIARVLQRTWEHLFLVVVSLCGAIAVSIPLGIVAARWPRWGRVILSATGLVQTIPSLALLVFMIPFLGIGTRPAIAALFCYSLLPIVRNTHSGLTDIPEDLRISAQALGLPGSARLRLIDLPLASRSILAGIKTSAVINVGTATLGALIGAGGYGQPILSGIRLDDVRLILEGAVPAALLALFVQGIFDLAERLIFHAGQGRQKARL